MENVNIAKKTKRSAETPDTGLQTSQEHLKCLMGHKISNLHIPEDKKPLVTTTVCCISPPPPPRSGVMRVNAEDSFSFFKPHQTFLKVPHVKRQIIADKNSRCLWRNRWRSWCCFKDTLCFATWKPRRPVQSLPAALSVGDQWGLQTDCWELKHLMCCAELQVPLSAVQP